MHKAKNLVSTSSYLNTVVSFKIYKEEENIIAKKESSSSKGTSPEYNEIIWIPVKKKKKIQNFLHFEG